MTEQVKPEAHNNNRERREEMDVMEHLRHSVNTLERIENHIGKLVGKGSDITLIKEEVSSCRDAIQSMSEDTANKLSSILSAQQEQGKVLAGIQLTLGSRKSLQIQFEGELPMTPGSMSDTQTLAATAIETDAAGQPVTIDPANAEWSIDDSTIASFTTNADGSATFKGLKPGNATVSLTDKATSAVGTIPLSVTASGPETITISFGDPQSPTPAPAPQQTT